MNNRVFFQGTLKEKLPIFLINTLLLHIPLLAFTAGQNDRRRNELILVGLGNLRFLQVHLNLGSNAPYGIGTGIFCFHFW